MATPKQIASMRRYLYGGSTKSGSLSTDDLGAFVDENVNLYLAASQAANAEAMKVASGGKKKVGDLEVDPGATAGMWTNLSKQLRLKGVRQVRPYSGGISVSDKSNRLSDTDRDAPAFKSGQFGYPGATT